MAALGNSPCDIYCFLTFYICVTKAVDEAQWRVPVWMSARTCTCQEGTNFTTGLSDEIVSHSGKNILQKYLKCGLSVMFDETRFFAEQKIQPSWCVKGTENLILFCQTSTRVMQFQDE